MRRIWVLMVLIIGLLTGCGDSNQQPEPATQRPVATPRPTSIPTPTQPASPTLNPTITPVPTSDTPAESRANIVLFVVDCSWKFCPPEELEQQVVRVIGQPGIHTATTLDELHVRLVYDPTQLTVEEAISLFEQATRLEVEQR